MLIHIFYCRFDILSTTDSQHGGRVYYPSANLFSAAASILTSAANSTAAPVTHWPKLLHGNNGTVPMPQ